MTREKVRPEDAGQAVAAAADIGYPVVLKAFCRDLVHKSDIGAVRLGLKDKMPRSRRPLAKSGRPFSRALSAAEFEGCLVQEMRVPRQELLLGIKRDPQLGPVVVAGAGGVLVELLADVQMAPAPFDPSQARAMLERLTVWPLLAGFRGRPPLAIEAVAAALSALSWLAHDHAERIVELDVNPLGVGLPEEGVVALDARARIEETKS